MTKLEFSDLGLDLINASGKTDSLSICLSKSDIRILLSALTKYIESSKIEFKLDLENAYMYIDENNYNSHLLFLLHSFELHNRLIKLYKKYENK